MSRYWNEKEDFPNVFAIIRDIAIVLTLIIAAGMYGCPQYSVYEQKLRGQAELGRASQNRQIAIQEAEAKHAAATELAQAEIERAKGVAQANKIIGESLQNNEAYLRYLWIDTLHTTQNQIIYVPTEANLPILEAGRRPLLKVQQ